jgi:UDP-2,3-diacylglucosamine pyrophosphatase LpxH
MDYLVDVALFLLGGGAGYLSGRLRRPAQEIVEVTRTIAQAFGRDGVYVRFTRANGSVTVRKFLPIDLDEVIEFRGVIYAAGEYTPDGHVYNEVVSG